MLRIINLFKSFFIRVKSCFYVGATDILPEPLSSEDEEAFIREMEADAAEAEAAIEIEPEADQMLLTGGEGNE